MARQQNTGKFATWIKRLGVAGFLFFLVKGLVWLCIFYFAGKGCFLS